MLVKCLIDKKKIIFLFFLILLFNLFGMKLLLPAIVFAGEEENLLLKITPEPVIKCFDLYFCGPGTLLSVNDFRLVLFLNYIK